LRARPSALAVPFDRQVKLARPDKLPVEALAGHDVQLAGAEEDHCPRAWPELFPPAQGTTSHDR
jgi:hypothetical protein